LDNKQEIIMDNAGEGAAAVGDEAGRFDTVVEKVIALVASQCRLPASTYRLQFHAGFTFRAAGSLVAYLQDLGVSDCYASPYLKARAGSKHGYDISDHQLLNPEIGADEDYDTWVQALQQSGIGQILDIVPNHMGIVGNENEWWNDVLENGPCSRHAGFFDIDWRPIKIDLRDKVLLGILGDPYGKVLESGQLTLGYETGTFAIHYFQHRFPVAPESALSFLRLRFDELEQTLGKESAEVTEYQSILTALGHLPPRSESNPLKIDERYREKEVIKRRLQTLTDASGAIREFILQNLAIINGNKNEPHSFDLLDDLLNHQAYRLAFWKVAADEINYRRFFDVNELAALGMEKPDVFEGAHRLILRLLAERKVTGVRLDHPDGLYDPRQYFERLQRHYVVETARRLIAAEALPITVADLGKLQAALCDRQAKAGKAFRPLYVVAEKILGQEEPIPEDWPIHGTTGYEFLNQLNGLFVDAGQKALFSRIYQRWTGMDANYRSHVYEQKFLILQVSLAGELHMLARQLDRLSEKNRWSRDFTLNSLRHALREIIACFPVYRSYITDEVPPRDHVYVESAVRQAKRRNPALSSSIFDFVRDMLLLRYPDAADETDRAEQRRFVGKFQQVTAPVMAKGVEDTLFYVFNRLLSLNEVGGDPARFGVSPTELHAFFLERQGLWPHALSATSTHDTKRSEEVRARLNVLSELPRDWQAALSRWKRLNERHRVHLESGDAPSRNDEYHLYQTLIGAWPLGAPSQQEHAKFVGRICQYMGKAVHEAKVHSSWINPNPAYDDAVQQFVARILDEKINGRFLADMRAFLARIQHLGLFNSLAQTLLKLTAPGVPDVYQGTELWDFSLVDPDNRRPVDYDRRRLLLAELKARMGPSGEPSAALARELTETKEDGRIKLYLTWRGLHCRREHPGRFTEGEYVPASALGERADNVFAFIRRLEERWALAAVPRLVARLMPGARDLPLGTDVWRDTVLVLPGIRPHERCRNIFTGEVHCPSERDGQTVLPLGEVFADFPVAVLMGI
jgi:(1->4)-alpha-D-glucan 1-alpha-D-glucosylmutase